MNRLVRYSLNWMMVVTLMFSAVMSFGQDSITSSGAPRHSINAELLGKALYFGSVSYEYMFNRTFSVGAGLGYYHFYHQEDHLEFGSSLPVYVQFHLGGHKYEKNFFITQIGVGNSIEYWTWEYDIFKSRHLKYNLRPFVGVGWEQRFGLDDRMLNHFRVVAYLIGDDDLPASIGLTYGRRFGK